MLIIIIIIIIAIVIIIEALLRIGRRWEIESGEYSAFAKQSWYGLGLVIHNSLI